MHTDPATGQLTPQDSDETSKCEAEPEEHRDSRDRHESGPAPLRPSKGITRRVGERAYPSLPAID